jgi:LysM repeat protein
MQHAAHNDGFETSFGERPARPSLREEVIGLRRRLWLERAMFSLLAAGFLSMQMAPRWFPRVWAVYLQDQPVLAMEDRRALEDTLTRVKAAPGASASVASLLASARLGQVDPRRLAPTDPGAAAAALQRAVGERAERGVIYVNGTPVVALPEPAQADAVIAALKQKAAGPLKALETPPDFKEPIEVRAEPAPAELWGDRETALGLLSGAGAEEGGVHTVRPGESAWQIARRSRTSIAQLKSLNPGVNLERLKVGQQLQLGKAAAPLVTLVTTGTLTETIPAPYGVIVQRHPKMFVGKTVVKRAGRPGAQRITYRVTVENGKVVRREVVSRQKVRAARDAILAVGARPRG